MSIVAIRQALADEGIESVKLPDGRQQARSTWAWFAGTSTLSNGRQARSYVVEAYVQIDAEDDPELAIEEFADVVHDALQSGLDAGGMATPAGVDETDRLDEPPEGCVGVSIPLIWPA